MIILALFLLLQMRVRVVAVYNDDGPHIWAGFGPILKRVYPPQEKSARALEKAQKREEKQAQKKEKKKSRTKASQKEPDKGADLGGTLELLWELLPVALKAAGQFRRKLCIRELTLHLTWGAADPADAAIAYGRANGVMASILPILEASFKVKKRNTAIELDYTLDKPKVFVRAALSITPMQVLGLGLGAGRKALAIYLKHRKKTNRKDKAVQKNGT